MKNSKDPKYAETCDTKTNKPLPNPRNPNQFVACDGYRNPSAATFITDDNQFGGYQKSLRNLVLGAYLLPDGAKYKKTSYTYVDFVKEALRITNIFFINPATKMNPNMNYAQIVPIGPAYAKSAAEYKIDSTTKGRGIGMISLTEYMQQLLDSLILLEELPKVQAMEKSL